MENEEIQHDVEEEEVEGEEHEEEEAEVTFDDIVSFTMLIETGVTILGMVIFFSFVILGIF